MASLKPLRDKVVVERSEAEQKTAGGILLPDTAKDKPKEGTVVAVGPGRILDNGEVKALEVKKGDRVLFGGFAGSEVKLDGKERTGRAFTSLFTQIPQIGLFGSLILGDIAYGGSQLNKLSVCASAARGPVGDCVDDYRATLPRLSVAQSCPYPWLQLERSGS